MGSRKQNDHSGEIQIAEIEIPENLQRTRVNEKAIASLADSIERIGLINPVVVRTIAGGFELVAGYRRYLAHLRLKREWIRANVTLLAEDAADQITLDENLERDDVSVVDEALWIGRLKEKENLSDAELARKLGKSAGWIAGRLAVLEWPEAVLSGLAEGDFSLAVARELAKCEDEEEIARLAVLIRENGATAAVVRYWVSMSNNARKFASESEESESEEVAEPVEYHAPQLFCDLCEQPTNYMESRLIRVCPRCFEISRANLKGDHQK